MKEKYNIRTKSRDFWLSPFGGFLTKVNPKTYRNMAIIYTFIIVSFDDEFNLYHSDLRHLIQILNIIFQNYTKLEYFGVSENLYFCPKMVIFAFNMN